MFRPSTPPPGVQWTGRRVGMKPPTFTEMYLSADEEAEIVIDRAWRRSVGGSLTGSGTSLGGPIREDRPSQNFGSNPTGDADASLKVIASLEKKISEFGKIEEDAKQGWAKRMGELENVIGSLSEKLASASTSTSASVQDTTATVTAVDAANDEDE